jgi:hypothetical protein
MASSVSASIAVDPLGLNSELKELKAPVDQLDIGMSCKLTNLLIPSHPEMALFGRTERMDVKIAEE